MPDRQVLFFPVKEIAAPWIEMLSEEENVLFKRSRDKSEPLDKMLQWLGQYDIYKELFIPIGITKEMFRHIRIVALLETFDIYHLFNQCLSIPEGGTYLEIGSNCGGSLLCTWYATKDKSLDYITIDPFYCENFVETAFTYNTEHINKTHYRFPSDSVVDKVAPHSIDFLLIDGDHTHEGTKRDILNYWSKLKIGGTMMVHDVVHPIFTDVASAVLETVKNHSLTRLESSTFAVVHKVSGML